jgi:phage terminase large subunit-like protein
LAGAEGAQVVVVATDERQAGLTFRIATRMVELHPALEQRVQLYHDHMAVPARGSSFYILPAIGKRLEGLDYTLALVDEAGRVDQEVFEVVTLATGKQKASVVLAIGTPGPELEQTVLGRLRTYALDHPGDPLVVWREHSAAGFEDHPVDCRHCWELANPAGGDFLAWDGLEACLPPKMREASFRRARLCQLTDTLEEAWLPPGSWAACTDVSHATHDGAEVVLAFDGSFNGDTTVLVVATVAERPHIDLVELWDAAGTQVPIVDVEASIRAACRRWKVREIDADPFRWARSLQLLEGEGLPVLEYPQSPGRMTPATARFYEAVVNGQLTHSGDSRLARHIGNAILREDARGARLAKERKDSPRRIDAAVAAVMAHDRAAALAGVTRDSIYI